jgi:O-antigen/teichoic acid export membrane protein
LVASAYHRRELRELDHLTRIASRAALGFAAAVAVLLVVAGKPLLAIFGPEFVRAYPALLILLIGGTVNAFTGIVAYLLTLTGRQVPALMIFIGALVLSAVLNVLLIPKFGTVGAAISSSAALAGWNLAMLLYVRRTIGIDASALGLAIRPAGGT